MSFYWLSNQWLNLSINSGGCSCCFLSWNCCCCAFLWGWISSWVRSWLTVLGCFWRCTRSLTCLWCWLNYNRINWMRRCLGWRIYCNWVDSFIWAVDCLRSRFLWSRFLFSLFRWWGDYNRRNRKWFCWFFNSFRWLLCSLSFCFFFWCLCLIWSWRNYYGRRFWTVRCALLFRYDLCCIFFISFIVSFNNHSFLGYTIFWIF